MKQVVSNIGDMLEMIVHLPDSPSKDALWKKAKTTFIRAQRVLDKKV